MTSNISIQDPLDGAASGAIEVHVQIGEATRWCFFMTPEALRTCGDTLPQAHDVRVHLGVPHMIVVSRIDQQVIETVLRDLDVRGELFAHTCAIDSPEVSDEEQFLRAVQALRDSRLSAPELWESNTIEDYLEAALAWANDSGFGASQGVSSPWAKVQAFLEAGRVYE